MSIIDEGMIKVVKSAVSDCRFGGVISITAVILDPGQCARARGYCELCGAIRAGYIAAGDRSAEITDDCKVKRLAQQEVLDENV